MGSGDENAEIEPRSRIMSRGTQCAGLVTFMCSTNKHYEAKFSGSRTFTFDISSAKMKSLLLYLSFLGLSLAFKFPVGNPIKAGCYKPEFDKNIAEVM